MQAGKEKLCLIRPRGDALALETLFLSEDVYSQAEIDEAVGETEVKEAELDLARQVIDCLVGDFEPKEVLVSEYRRDLRSLLEAKLAGEEIARPQPLPETPVADLLEALKRSVADIQRRKAAGRQVGRKAPAKKRARRRRFYLVSVGAERCRERFVRVRRPISRCQSGQGCRLSATRRQLKLGRQVGSRRGGVAS